MIECLKEIVGVIKKTTTCLPNVTTISKSGLYMDDIDEGYIPVNQALYSIEGTELEFFKNLIEVSTNEVLRDLSMNLKKFLSERYTEFHTTIGLIDNWTDILSSSSGHYYMTIKPRSIVGGTITIHSIKIRLQNGFFNGDIKVVKKSSFTPIYSGPISDYKKLTIPLDEEIYIMYQSPTPPVNFKHIGCCGVQNPPYRLYSEIGIGTIANYVSNDDLKFTSSEFANGIQLNCSFSCDQFKNICNVDFQNSNFGLSFSHSVKQTARKNMAYWLLMTDKVTPYISVTKDEIVNIIEFLKSDIKENIDYMPMVYNLSDCFICRETSSKYEILV